MSYQDDFTLEEIQAYDAEMADDAIRNAKRYAFYNKNQAWAYMGHCLQRTVEYLGIKNADKIPNKMLDRIQREKKIRIEQRTKYRGKEAWKNGFYIYQKDVLVAFVSEVLSVKASPLLVKPDVDRFYVITNTKGV